MVFKMVEEESDDNFIYQYKPKNINFYLNLTYFSRHEERRIIIDSNKETIVGDLINYNIKIIDNKNLKNDTRKTK